MRLPEKNWLEWVVFAIGVLCIGAVISLLARDALRSPGAEASVVVRFGEMERRAGHQYVPITVVNSGGQAATGVQVEVLLDRDGQVVDRARFVVDLIPRNARREGWVAFDSAAAPGVRVRTGGVAFEAP
jgi:uncharacterized protein (TIGR02588 family)